MEVIFKGAHSAQEAAENLLGVLMLFKEKYGVENVGEVHLSMTLMDDSGSEVELVDGSTSEVYRTFEVLKGGAPKPKRQQRSHLSLVVDNT